VSTAIVSNELEHHMFPVVRYAQIGGGAAGFTAVAGSDGPVRDSSGAFCSFRKRYLLAAFKEQPHKWQEQRQF
jgi:hypothetical protein